MDDRTFKFWEVVDLQQGEDAWPLMLRLDQNLAAHVAQYEMRQTVEVDDKGGTSTFQTVAAAKKERDALSRHELRRIQLHAREDRGSRSVIAIADRLEGPQPTIVVQVWGQPEAEVVGLGRVLVDEVRAMVRPSSAPEVRPEPSANVVDAPVAQPEESPRGRRILNHPWVIATGSAVLAGLIVLAITLYVT